MDKNTIIGFGLIAAVLIGFTLWSKPSDEELAKQRERYIRDSIEYARALETEQAKATNNGDDIQSTPKTDAVNDFFVAPTTQDTVASVMDSIQNSIAASNQVAEVVTLENSKVRVDISTKGGQVAKVQLKGYSKFDGDSLYLFDNDASFNLLLKNKQRRTLNTSDLVFTPITTQDKESMIMRFSYSENQYIDFIYKLADDDFMLKYDINLVGMQDLLDRETADMFEMNWTQNLHRQEKNIKNEQRYSRIYYKYLGNSVEEMSESKNEEIEAKEPTKWIAFKDQFFASIIIADEKFETALLNSKVLASEDYLKSCDAKLFAPVKMENNSLKAGFTYFYGPMEYSHLKQYDENISDASKQLDLDKLVPLGWSLFRWVNQYFIIPLFNLLKTSGLSMGIVILLLTVIVKLIISPLTYKSFMSSAKMRVLRPQVEELNAKYPKQEQATEKQQAVMALYSRAGANPMSGCIPMLLQMPILIALFQFFPNAIELRHQSFLWADDLSTYDAIIEWGTAIPLIGTHISLFCILMTVTNIIYTKFNMEATNTGQQQMPGMKWMMYLMPVVFLFVLNDYPSGLTYYYFVSTLITIILTLSFRFFINEEKLLAKLEANKAKPKKKSGFMARLEEAQRMQQKQMQEANKKKKKK